MRTRLVTFLFFLIILCLACKIALSTSFAEGAWVFKKTYDGRPLINSPFFLISAADIDKNGKKEIIATDFGLFGNHIEEWKEWKEVPTRFYNLFVLEWEHGELAVKLHKQWDMEKPKTREEQNKYFFAYEAGQIMTWKIQNKVIVETIPPYLGLEWIDGKYMLREQQGWAQVEPLVGSWALTWLSPSCYSFFPNKRTWPQECIIGIRDFLGNGRPKIVTILEDKIDGRKYKQILRVRKSEPGFSIAWEMLLENGKYFGGPYEDKLNKDAKRFFLIELNGSWYSLEPQVKGSGYQLKPLPIKKDDYMEIARYDLPDIYLRSTQKKGVDEYWGYRPIGEHKIYPYPLLRKVVLKPDESGFIREDIDFPHHEAFLGVGYFDLKDIDNDGLDELILVEETGNANSSDESVYFTNVKDYIRILKWDGTQYQTMWVSPPYAKRGTKFLVEDIKNTGSKQLVVFTPSGLIQIWEIL